MEEDREDLTNQTSLPEQQENGEQPVAEMPFLDHLEELRWRLLKALAAVVLGAIVCFVFKEQLLNLLTYPYYDAVESLQNDRSAGTVEAIRNFFKKWFPEIAAAQTSPSPDAPSSLPQLQAIKPMTFFFVYLQISFFGGLVMALPLVSYQLWRFIAPGMLPGEKRLVLPIAALSVLCFSIGALLAYWIVLPLGVRFFLALEPEGMISQWDIGAYISLAVRLLMGFGLVLNSPSSPSSSPGSAWSLLNICARYANTL